MAVGTSFGDLQAAIDRENAQREALLETSRQNMARGLQYYQGVQAQNRAETERQQQSAQNQALAAQRLAQEKAYQEGTLGVQKSYLDLQKAQGTPAANREHDLTFNRALNDATNAVFDPKNYPTLTPGEIASLQQHHEQATSAIKGEESLAMNEAAAMNRRHELTMQIAKSNELINSHSIVPFVGPSGNIVEQEKKRLKDATDELSKLPAPTDVLKRGRVQYDVKSGAYVPAIPIRQWPAANPAAAPAAPGAPAGPAGVGRGLQIQPDHEEPGGPMVQPAPTAAIPVAPRLLQMSPAIQDEPPSGPIGPIQDEPMAGPIVPRPRMQYEPFFYDLVNRFISQGLAPAAAKARALQARQALSALQ